MARSLPWGLNATAPWPPIGPTLVWMVLPVGRPVAGFHSRIVPSPPVLASSLPSGLNATPNTPHLALAWRAVTRRPVAGFHSRTVPSPPPLPTPFPPRLHPTAPPPHPPL